MNKPKKKVLLLSGGSSSEHDISLVSASYLKKQLAKIEEVSTTHVIFNKSGELPTIDHRQFDYVIPYFHGYPGESGDIQSLLDFHKLHYLGAGSEAHKSCFNKVTTKLYCEKLAVPSTPFVFLTNADQKSLDHALRFFEKCPAGVFIKASRQGSSVGCYLVKNKEDFLLNIHQAFQHDTIVLLEELLISPRELELSAFEYQGELHVTLPGEIQPPKDSFYTFEEKYSKDSNSHAKVEANIDDETKKKMQEYARTLFKALEIKDMARIDFFMTQDRKIYLNEINTFPGLTPISMFPKMMEHYGVKFQDFLRDRIL